MEETICRKAERKRSMEETICRKAKSWVQNERLNE